MHIDSSSLTCPTPTSLIHCLDGGNLNIFKYYFYRKRRIRDQRNFFYVTNIIKKKCNVIIKRKVFQHRKKHEIKIRNNDGILRKFTPTDTLWYLLYIKTPPCNKYWLTKFRQRFRIPYDTFI